MLIKVLFIAAFFNCLAWIFLIPIWQYPDEQAHFGQVQFFANYGYKPSTFYKFNTSQEVTLSEKVLKTERDGQGNNKFTYNPSFRIQYSSIKEGHYEEYLKNLNIDSGQKLVKYEATSNPPMYYLLASNVYKIFEYSDIFTRVFAVRILSAIIFLCNLFVCYEVSKLIFKNNDVLQITLTSLIAFMPMLVFSSTGVLPDTLTNFLFSLIILFSLTMISAGISIKIMIASVLVVIMGLLTRQQFSISIPILLMAIIWKIPKNTPNLIKLAFIFTSFIFIAYISGRTGVAFFSEIRIPEIDVFNTRYISTNSILEYAKFSIGTYYNQTIPWYFGVYKWLSLTLPLSFYRIIKITIFIAIVGVIGRICLSIKSRKEPKENNRIAFLVFSSLIYLGIFVIGDYFFFINRGYSFGIQGRYFFPMIIAHFCLIVVGLWTVLKVLFNNYAKLTLPLIVLAQIIFNDLSLWHVAGSYYNTSDLNTFLVQASQYKPSFAKGANIITTILVALSFQVFLILITLKQVMHKK